MATHSSVLAWRIPGMVEPGGLPPMGSHRVGHDRNDLAAAAPYSLSIHVLTILNGEKMRINPIEEVKDLLYFLYFTHIVWYLSVSD